MCLPRFTIETVKTKPIQSMIQSATKNLWNCWAEIIHHTNNDGETTAYLVVAHGYSILMITIEKTIEDVLQFEHHKRNFGIPLTALQDMLRRTTESHFTIEHNPDENTISFQSANVKTTYEADKVSGVDYADMFLQYFSTKNPALAVNSEFFKSLKFTMGNNTFPALMLHPLKRSEQPIGTPITKLIVSAISLNGSALFGALNLHEPILSKDLFKSENNINLYFQKDVEFLLNFYNQFKGLHNDFTRIQSITITTTDGDTENVSIESEGICNGEREDAQLCDSGDATELSDEEFQSLCSVEHCN